MEVSGKWFQKKIGCAVPVCIGSKIIIFQKIISVAIRIAIVVRIGLVEITSVRNGRKIMKILRPGKQISESKRFTCKKCGCFFEADKGEYSSMGQMAYIHDGIEFKAICPCCKNECYV